MKLASSDALQACTFSSYLLYRFSLTTPCCALIFCALTLLCPYFSSYLPCCTLLRKTLGEVAKRPAPGIFARNLCENVRKLRLSGTSNTVRLMFLRPTALQRVWAGRASKISPAPPTPRSCRRWPPSENGTTSFRTYGPQEIPSRASG